MASKKVIWSLSGKVQQVMRQPIAALPKNLLCCFYGFWQSCNALRVFRFATQAVTFLAVHLSCVRGSSCVLHPASFISSSVTLHYTSFAAGHLLSRHDILWQTHRAYNSMHMPFSKHTLQYSLGFIALTTSFIHFSRLQSTRCQ